MIAGLLLEWYDPIFIISCCLDGQVGVVPEGEGTIQRGRGRGPFQGPRVISCIRCPGLL